MRGKVFIGWTQDQSLANCVKRELSECEYEGICGGKDGGNRISHSINDTVAAQMDECCSAIMLLSLRESEELDENGNKVKVKTLSPNMLYELGYLSGSLHPHRVLSVYLDGAEAKMPTDIVGGWHQKAFTAGKTNEEMAKEIVEIFLKDQCGLLTDNKMKMMTDLSALRNDIRAHIKKPRYYNDELAYLVLLLSQASYMHAEMDNDEKLLGELLSADIEDERCLLAIHSTGIYFEACRSLEKTDSGMKLRDRKYRELLRKIKTYVKQAETLKDDEFRAMFLMVGYDYLSFINMMYYGEKPEEIEFREEVALKSLAEAEKFIAFDKKNREIAQLYKSYTLRNLALFYRAIGRMEDAQKRFEESIENRRELYDFFKMHPQLSKTVAEQIKMEYYLSLKDNLLDVAPDVREDRIWELEDYIQEINEESFNRKHLIGGIEQLLREISAAV